MDPTAPTGPRLSPARVCAAGMALLLVGVVLVTPLRVPGRFVSVASDLGHAPVFAILVFGLVRIVGGSRPSLKLAIGVAVGAVAFGFLGEVLQHFSGRNARLADGLANAIGAAAGLLALLWPMVPARIRAAAVCVLLLLTVGVHYRPACLMLDIVRQQMEMPVLASFENELELSRWNAIDADMERSEAHVTHGDYALRATLRPAQYPHCELSSPPTDWSGYDALEFDVFNESDHTLELITRIQDFHHNGEYSDRYHKTSRLPGGWTTVRIDLADVRNAPEARETDMTLITRLSLFTIDLETSHVLYLDRFVLRRDADAVASR